MFSETELPVLWVSRKFPGEEGPGLLEASRSSRALAVYALYINNLNEAHI
jgi:hypothetical protein